MLEMDELFFKGCKDLFQKEFDDKNHLFLTFPFRILMFLSELYMLEHSANKIRSSDVTLPNRL